jgi:hypothetical protein
MTSDDDGLPFYHWQRKPPTRKIVATPGERLWELRREHVTRAAELIFRGESYGWECRVLREGELFRSWRFLMRAPAERWAYGATLGTALLLRVRRF